MNINIGKYTLFSCICMAILLSACQRKSASPLIGVYNSEQSSSTGWEYKQKAEGGFEMVGDDKSANDDEYTEERMITYNASLSLSVKKLENQAEEIVALTKAQGGYMVSSSSAYVTVRVPADKLNTLMDMVAALGKEEGRSVSGKDVTDYYHDTKLRLESAQKTRLRYLELLQKAENVSDILLIEKELERLNVQIERMEGALNSTEEQVRYSLLYVRLRERVKPGPLGYVFYGLWRGVKFLFVRG